MKVIVNVTTNLILRLFLIAVFIMILIAVIAYARGYRLNQDGTVTSTGILSINSSPQPATVYINGQLKGATDVNLTLPYGQYTVEVKKEGYTDWKKTISLKGETVMSLDAHLYSKNPSLTPLTTLGIIKAVPLGNTDQILLISQTGDVLKDGIYLFEAGQRIAIFPPLNPILLKSTLPEGTDLRTIAIDFNPNYRQAIMTLEAVEGPISYLLSLEEENLNLIDVTTSKNNILAAWTQEKNTEMLKVIETLPRKMRAVALSSFEVISLSPDEKRLMYLATKDVTLPVIIDPPLIGANQSREERTLKKGSLYIYDKKEDKNFRVPVEIDSSILDITPAPEPDLSVAEPSITPTPAPQVGDERIIRAVQERVLWYPTSDYIAVKERNQINLIQYDGDNKQTVYAGPFSPDFFAISPDWNLIVIINLNPNNNQYGDLYSVGVR